MGVNITLPYRIGHNVLLSGAVVRGRSKSVLGGHRLDPIAER
jgi:hypothetical protein